MQYNSLLIAIASIGCSLHLMIDVNQLEVKYDFEPITEEELARLIFSFDSSSI